MDKPPLNNRKKWRERIICLFVFASFFCLARCARNEHTKQFSGRFIANDCGESHGGFEWVGEYTAALQISGSQGYLALTLSAGLGDPLTKHQFGVSEFAEAAGNLSFKIDGKQALLVLDENDTIWNGQFNGYYSANKSAAPPERIGLLPVEAFSGFQPHYYVELRLKPI